MMSHTTPVERFWSRVSKSDGCWQWTGTLLPNGYGSMSFKGAFKYAHRLAYELEVGPIPTGYSIDHLCRNRACVNPGHLEAVTPRENLMRSGFAPASFYASRTACSRGHEYTAETTQTIRRGESVHRRCRICARARRRTYRAARKAAAA